MVIMSLDCTVGVELPQAPSRNDTINATEKILRNQNNVVIDYVRIVHRLTLSSQTVINRDSVLLIAAHVGATRLIDNTVLFDEN